MEPSEPTFIVVVGASAGGLNSIIELCAQLNHRMNLSVFVVLHITQTGFGEFLVARIQKSTEFTCKMAEDGETIRSQHIYLAVPDKHLLVQQGKILLGMGPAENRWRPSIDVLFRSAAAAYNGRVIGIILSGLMQDGTSGMLAIKRCGGTCVVQDPKEAEYPDMPVSVLENVKVDHCLPLLKMGALLEEKSRNGFYDTEVPPDVQAEAEIAQKAAIGIDNVQPLGERAPYSCPDCGGALWEMVHENVVRYRCHTGHVYNAGELLLKMDNTLEQTLWTALRMMEERKNLLDKMYKEETSKGWILTAAHKKERAEELQEHIKKLKQVLFASKMTPIHHLDKPGEDPLHASA